MAESARLSPHAHVGWIDPARATRPNIGGYRQHDGAGVA